MSSFLETLHRFTAPKDATPPVTDHRNLLPDSGFFTSKRFIVTAVFFAGLWLLHSVLTSEVLRIAANVAIAYILGDTISKSATTAVNGWIRVSEIKQDVEYEKLPPKV